MVGRGNKGRGGNNEDGKEDGGADHGDLSVVLFDGQNGTSRWRDLGHVRMRRFRTKRRSYAFNFRVHLMTSEGIGRRTDRITSYITRKSYCT